MIALLLLAGASAAEVADGAALYATFCASCHGAAGHGDGPVAGALDPQPTRFDDPAFWADRDEERIRTAVLRGGPAVGKSPLMAGFQGRLDPAQVDAIVAWLRRSFEPGAPGETPPSTAPPPTP